METAEEGSVQVSPQQEEELTQRVVIETAEHSEATANLQALGETQIIQIAQDSEHLTATVQEDGTVITTETVTDGETSMMVPTGQPVAIVSTAGEVNEDGTVTITMVHSMDESGQIQHHHEHEEGTDLMEQKVKIMSVTSGQTAAEQIAAALAEAVAGTEEESNVGADETSQEGHQIIMEDESSMSAMEIEANQEPWNEEGCLVCNKDIKFDDPLQIGKPINAKLKEFFLEYLAVGDNVQLENENVFPFCEPCATDLEKLMNINRKIEYMHKEFNKLRDEVAKKAVKTYITRSKPEWLEDDLRTEAYGNYFPEGDKPKTHKEQLYEVWKNRYELIQPGPKGPMMIRSMDSRGRVTVVRLNSSGQPVPERQLASTDSNLSRVARVMFNGDDDDSAGIELYKCRECPKTFNIKAMLDYHMKVHANANKPYKCNECGKGFAQRGGLVTHSLVHTGAKPYVCQVCEKAFRQKYHLTQHNLIHSGVKPFSCEICHKSFNVKMNLREHMRRHTGDRPYKCPFCTIIGFFRKKMLKEHIIKSHPEEEMPEELLGAETSFMVGEGSVEVEMDMEAVDQAEMSHDDQLLDESEATDQQEQGTIMEGEIATDNLS